MEAQIARAKAEAEIARGRSEAEIFQARLRLSRDETRALRQRWRRLSGGSGRTWERLEPLTSVAVVLDRQSSSEEL